MLYKFKFFIYKSIFLFLLIWCEYSFSQCSFNLETTVVKNSVCFANGVIDVNVSGAEIDLTNVHIHITNGGDIDQLKTKDSARFETLPPGTYTITATSFCKSTNATVSKTATETITSDYRIPVVIPKNTLRALSCLHTGIIELTIFDGSAPYKITMTSSPASYSGDTIFSTNNGGIFSIDSLAPGDYTFKVIDNCLYEVPVSCSVEKMPSDFPSNPYESSLYANSGTSGCNEVSVRKNNYSQDYYFYWVNNGEKYYEVRFSMNGNLQEWHTLSNLDTLTLPYTYKMVKDSAYSVDVDLRIKGCPSSETTNVDKIYPSPININAAAVNKACDKFDLESSLSASTDLICFPGKFKLFDESNNIIDSLEIANYKKFYVSGLKYNTDYRILFIDAEGYGVSQKYKYRKSIGFSYSEEECTTYSSSFSFSPLNSICYPYSLDIYSSTGRFIISKNGITSDKHPVVIAGFEYDTAYRVVCKDSRDSILETTFSVSQGYYVSSSTNYCRGNDFLKTTVSVYPAIGEIPSGMRIRQLSGPTKAKHPDITLTTKRYAVYPFSSSYLSPEYTHIDSGEYKFEISCDNRCDTVVFQKKLDELKDFSFTTQESCDGLRVFPKGSFYSNNIPQGASFRITSPAVTPTRIHSSESNAYFTLQMAGTYLLEILHPTYSGSCAADTLIIHYDNRNLKLSSRSVYICKPGDMPRFNLKATGGVTPYLYELLENNIVVQSNSTGDFVYGDVNHQYAIRVSDACSNSFATSLQVLDLSVDMVINVNNKICIGDTIFFSCLSLGSTNFHWQGPNFNSFDQNTFLPNAKKADSGIYSLTFKPLGCTDPVQQSINVVVSTPPQPLCVNPIEFCLGETSSTPVITSPDNLLVSWYLNDKETEYQAPIVDKTVVHQEQYYIAQKDTSTGCISPKCELIINVNPLPSPADVNSPHVCANNNPSIELLHSVTGYTYLLYPTLNSSKEILSLEGNGGNIYTEIPKSIWKETTFYLKIDDSKCFYSDSFRVGIKYLELPAPLLIEAQDICTNNSPNITLFNSVGNYTYHFYLTPSAGNPVVSMQGTGSNLNDFLPITLASPTTFHVKVSDEKCSTKDRIPFSVDIKYLSIYPENLPDYERDEPYSQQLTTSSWAESPVFTLINGQMPEGLSLNSSGLISGTPKSEKEVSRHTFTVKVEDIIGCIGFREYELSSNLFIPNVFTPNRDGFNDIFMSEYHVVIFDRFGVKIFDGETGWDGTYKGQDAPPDIYFYKVYYTTSDGETKTQTGYVGLER